MTENAYGKGKAAKGKPMQYSSRFTIENKTGIPLLSCPSLGTANGCSTRLGGVSTGAGHETLDLGVSDDPLATEENRRRFAAAFGTVPERLLTAKQVHSARVETVTGADPGKSFLCDGFVTRCPGLLLTVKTADCVPILLCDREAGVIAALHAGWRGTAAGIALRGVRAMRKLGADPRRIRAAVFPSIRSCCYQVDDPFLEAVKEAPCGSLCLPHVTPDKTSPGHFRADLQEMNAAILREAGVPADRIFVSGFCTCCCDSLFFSHRASGGKRGLLMSGIML